MMISSTLKQLIIFNASADVPITSMTLNKKKTNSEHIRKLPISEIRTTDISKKFLQSLALRIIEVWLYIVPRLFEEKQGNIVVGFAWFVVRGSEFIVGTLWAQLLLQF